jgi:hypothetical protein
MHLFEGTLLGFEEEGFSLEKVKDIVHNLSVEGRVIWSGDQDVVHVNKDHVRVLQFEGLEDAIHYSLEGRGSIALTKQHNHGLEEPERRFECGFPLVSISDVDIVVPPSDIKFCEETFPSQISCE